MWVRDKLRSFFDSLIRGEEPAVSIYFWTMLGGGTTAILIAAAGYLLNVPR